MPDLEKWLQSTKGATMCDLCPSAAPTETRRVLDEMRGLVWLKLCASCIANLKWQTDEQ